MSLVEPQEIKWLGVIVEIGEAAAHPHSIGFWVLFEGVTEDAARVEVVEYFLSGEPIGTGRGGALAHEFGVEAEVEQDGAQVLRAMIHTGHASQDFSVLRLEIGIAEMPLQRIDEPLVELCLGKHMNDPQESPLVARSRLVQRRLIAIAEMGVEFAEHGIFQANH